MVTDASVSIEDLTSTGIGVEAATSLLPTVVVLVADALS